MSKSIRAWLISDGKIGDEVQCLGILAGLGLTPERRRIAPRKIFAAAMPWGPIDPRDSRDRAASPLNGPLPDLVVSAGRRCVPYVRYLKRLSRGAIFTVFVKDPYCRSGIDVIWAPDHDRLRGDNVVTTLTPANRLTAEIIAAARAAPDSRIAALPAPRVAIMLGGPSKHHRFGTKEDYELETIATALASNGASVMVTPSRRTPERLTDTLRRALFDKPLADRAFVWDGQSDNPGDNPQDNPYVAMLANAQSIIVTGDSVNMIGEALASGVPVHVYEPSGGHPKITAYIDALAARGLVRRWRGALESWDYAPVNVTAAIAAEIARRYGAFRAKKGGTPPP